MSWAIPVKVPSGECHETSQMRQHCSGNGLVLSGFKPFPGSMLTEFYITRLECTIPSKCPIILKWSTGRCSTIVLNTWYYNNRTTETVMDELDFTRSNFMTHFGEISFIATSPWLSYLEATEQSTCKVILNEGTVIYKRWPHLMRSTFWQWTRPVHRKLKTKSQGLHANSSNVSSSVRYLLFLKFSWFVHQVD